MTLSFLLGLFTGSIITASFVAWCAMHECKPRDAHNITRTGRHPHGRGGVQETEGYVTPASLLKRGT
jgi:hypothetical protein